MVESDSDPFIARAFSNVVDEAASLREAVIKFTALEGAESGPQELYHRVLAVVHEICAAIVACEESGIPREAIVRIMEPVRRIHARSPFVKRLQEWPRGYPGDFETVEYLCSGRARTSEDTLEHICETYALSRSIAQQHHNKVHRQAARIIRTLMRKPGLSRVLSIACGSCPDLRNIAAALPVLAGEIWLNDSDTDALTFSARELAAIRNRIHIRPGNALKFLLKARNLGLRFDLVLAGGLFDYLNEKWAVSLIEHAYSLLEDGGTFYFTNIARGNPYRPLIEYFGDWFLIERSEEDIYRYCEAAGIPRSAVRMTREETGLTLMVEVVKPS